MKRFRPKTIDRLVDLATTALKMGAVVGVAYFIFRSIKVLAAHTTTVNFSESLTVHLLVDAMITIPAVGWALWAERGRRRVIKRHAKAIEQEERALMPNRSTSGLTEHGGTNPRDK